LRYFFLNKLKPSASAGLVVLLLSAGAAAPALILFLAAPNGPVPYSAFLRIALIACPGSALPVCVSNVGSPMLVARLVPTVATGFAIVFHESAKEKFSEISLPVNLDRIYLIVGPEGGITEEELQLFSSINATVVRLGTPILRSAHAGFAAMSALQTKIGRW
jgi:RsmE family RNA methyltransferase